ncbi:hypothetical protein VNO77_38971 [Canavalia gladiata]|uniref:Uncharacterized protein n=1 Tax=Canavalia gladiata TaxID=3824 RepID=A0AAN9PZA8_CANGL
MDQDSAFKKQTLGNLIMNLCGGTVGSVNLSTITEISIRTRLWVKLIHIYGIPGLNSSMELGALIYTIDNDQESLPLRERLQDSIGDSSSLISLGSLSQLFLLPCCSTLLFWRFQFLESICC